MLCTVFDCLNSIYDTLEKVAQRIWFIRSWFFFLLNEDLLLFECRLFVTKWGPRGSHLGGHVTIVEGLYLPIVAIASREGDIILPEVIDIFKLRGWDGLRVVNDNPVYIFGARRCCQWSRVIVNVCQRKTFNKIFDLDNISLHHGVIIKVINLHRFNKLALQVTSFLCIEEDSYNRQIIAVTDVSVDEVQLHIVVDAVESVLTGCVNVKLKCLILFSNFLSIAEVRCAVQIHNFDSIEELANVWQLHCVLIGDRQTQVWRDVERSRRSEVNGTLHLTLNIDEFVYYQEEQHKHWEQTKVVR